jgi:signal peptidase I
VILASSCAKIPVIEHPSKIPRERISSFDNHTTIAIENYQWVYFNESETNSMYPSITKSSHAIGLRVNESTLIYTGDIISFRVKDMPAAYVHRIIEKGIDDGGEYFITKGDNNNNRDEIKLRRADIINVIVAIVY